MQFIDISFWFLSGRLLCKLYRCCQPTVNPAIEFVQIIHIQHSIVFFFAILFPVFFFLSFFAATINSIKLIMRHKWKKEKKSFAIQCGSFVISLFYWMRNPPHSFRFNLFFFLSSEDDIVSCTSWWNSFLMQNKHGDDREPKSDMVWYRLFQVEEITNFLFGNDSNWNCLLSAIDDLFHLFVHHLLYMILIVELLHFFWSDDNQFLHSRWNYRWRATLWARMKEFRRFGEQVLKWKPRSNNNR